MIKVEIPARSRDVENDVTTSEMSSKISKHRDNRSNK